MNRMKPKISIAMTTYNGEKYLREQLDSYLEQSRQPDELVVCDDRSSDTTLTILEEFRDTAPFTVHVVRNEINIGFVRNFENALSLCSGDIICLSDQDDVWLPDKLATVERLFAENRQAMVLINDQEICDGNLTGFGTTKLGNILALGYSQNCFMTGCCTSLRREWLSIVLPIPHAISSHDSWINRMAIAMQVRLLCEKPLQLYRRHECNASNWIASSITSVSKVDAIRTHGLKSAMRGWKKEMETIDLCIERIRQRAAALESMNLALPARGAIKAFEKRKSALERRAQIVSRSPWRRPAALVSFWLSGGYRNFAGWKSALKDMVRP
ncbi:glycosyltransferase family 2 protein [Azotobacter chroococcum]|uniref:glycosyltransferase family 2 protein n=1 Tax=Azotobacter chroococcum TaxID=353 RepID=UPI001F61FB42|nr:glycosyltransferase family 2 protein [Azotobacter chroococcum]